MISAAAVTLALAFWAPYNHGQAVCPDGVQVALYTAGADTPVSIDASGWAYLNGGCSIHLRADVVAEQPPRVQCALIAHELGHAVFGLPDSVEQGNIMGNTNGMLTVPAACDPQAHKTVGRSASRHPARRRHRARPRPS